MTIECVALMASDFEDGGVERNFTHLALGLARLGIHTSLLVGDPDHAYLRELHGIAQVLPVRGDRAAFLEDYLPQARPDILLTGKLSDDYAAVQARAKLNTTSPIQTRLVAAVGTLLSGRFAAHPWNLIKTWRETRRIRHCYRQLDGITAISDGVAMDLRQVFGIKTVPLAVLNNPIIPEDHESRATAACSHPWLASVPPNAPLDERPPIIIAVGGLRKVKDFATLLRAFARLERPQARLLIIGEGKQRTRLTSLATDLGISNRVDLPGFIPDPYPYISRARLLALSSRREGLGNAVVEALAVGTPVVATDCAFGLRDLLGQDGFLPLVPVGDPKALALALNAGLDRAQDRAKLQLAAGPFGLIPAAKAHLAFFQRLIDEGQMHRN